MTEAQTWDPEQYARNARFVAELGGPAVELLAPLPGERILDLGCGDGVLTRKLADAGCRVTGVDSSAPQIEAARKLGLDAHVVDARHLPFESEFDAVFSNAALHWVKEADAVIAGVCRALKPGGRFVAEMGGHGNVEKIRSALIAALNRRGLDGRAFDPWFFPSVDDYSARLRRQGFTVESIALIPRPTPLPDDITAWLETFAKNFTAALPNVERPAFFAQVQRALEPLLRDEHGQWSADYVRLRFSARKPGSASAT
jgi:trans-aconitate methyltransferase